MFGALAAGPSHGPQGPSPMPWPAGLLFNVRTVLAIIYSKQISQEVLAQALYSVYSLM